MAIPKVLGTETEFGITIRHQADFNPVLASGLVVNGSPDGLRLRWSLAEESPGRDARGRSFGTRVALDAETLNVLLPNGARMYVDHAHPEYSTPECLDAREAALHDKAGELAMARAANAVQRILEPGEKIALYKNNSDGKGNSYGAHENYLVSRALPFNDIVRYLTTFLVTRQVFTGSGKVGVENGRAQVDFQISQRADFIEERVGLETTARRPIINTRDEPHSDPERFRRLHIIIGDATRSEIQTYLKLGTTSLLLAAIEDAALPDALELLDPVAATWQVSHDIGLSRSLRLAGGGSATALELQWQYFDWLSKYAEASSANDVSRDVLVHWEQVLQDLEVDPMTTADRLDWTAKLRIMRAYKNREHLDWTHSRLRALDLQYHDVDPSRGLYDHFVERGLIRRLFTDAQVADALHYPPAGTRAYFRGRCVSDHGDALVAANWDSLVFDTGGATFKRVPMMDPLRGTVDRVGALFDASSSAADLLEALGGD
ncbi:MAG: proteasome accessory factor PafA2 [Gammaproteobacteria bacterium]|nr:proteasome accessory factor PafA2 [Gammaproteobacteria bacterium]